MLAHPVFHEILIDTYKEEIFPESLLLNSVYMTCPLNRVNFEQTDKIYY